jgi:hypothetical protein
MQNYHDAEGEEDREELLKFNADELLGEGGEEDGDEWVATHLNTKGQRHASSIS